MASTIVFRRGSTFPSQGSGITLAEPVFNTNLNTFHIGLGHGVTAEWIGAPISGASASISSAEAYKIPTAKAVKDYVTDYVTAVNGVLAVNGFAGGVTLAAGTGVSVAASSGTITITNTGVQSFNGSTGAVQGVSSFYGLTGAVGITAGTNVTITQSGNTLTISSSGGGSSITDYVVSFNGITGAVQGVSAAVAGTGISVSGATGAVTITNSGVQSFNGSTGAVSFVNYVSSFNGSTGAVQGVRYVNGRTGDIVILGGTNIGVTNSGVIVTVNNEGVLSVDGATGAINNVARTNTTNTFTQLQTFSNASGISAAQVITKTVQLPGNQTNLTITGAIFSDSVGIRLLSSDGLGGDYHTTVKGSVLTADRTITFPDTTGTVALTSQLMGAVNGSTAATTAVTSFNGLTGAVQGVSAAVAGTGISVSGATGSVTITNTGVLSFNGSTGAVQGVSSINGSTGAITNVAFTNVNNNFSANQTISAASANLSIVDSSSLNEVSFQGEFNRLYFYNDLSGGEVFFQPTIAPASTITVSLPDFTTTLAGLAGTQTFTGSKTFSSRANFSAGISASGGITFGNDISVSGNIAANNIVNAVNGKTGGITLAAGTGVSVAESSGTITITNTGVQSFNGSTGAVSFVNYVSSFNGSSGSVGISAGTGISITQSGTTYTIASTVSSGISRSIINVTGATTAGSASSTDYVYNGTSGPYAITLPTAVSNTNRYTIKNSGTGAISVYTTSSQTIDGITFYNLNKQYSAIDLMSDGSNWFIV